MDATLIPFALREVDQRFVGVVDVVSGLACGCICPSCKSRLIARKGNVKVWHFAHVSRAYGHQTETDCDFSWLVSVRLMARQLIGDGLDLDLPAVTDAVEASDQWGRVTRHIFPVAPACRVSIYDPRTDAPFAGALVDVLASIHNQPFVIYFTHAGRLLPEALSSPSDPCASVVSIALEQHALGVDNPTDELNDRQRLTEFLIHHLASKSWVYHPAMPSKRAEELDELKTRLGAQRQERQAYSRSAPAAPLVAPQPRFTLIEATPGEKPKYVCVKCDFRWGGSMGGKSPCPQCGSLYMTTHIRP